MSKEGNGFGSQKSACEQYQSFVEKTLQNGHECFRQPRDSWRAPQANSDNLRTSAACDSFRAQESFLRRACQQEQKGFGNR